MTNIYYVVSFTTSLGNNTITLLFKKSSYPLAQPFLQMRRDVYYVDYESSPNAFTGARHPCAIFFGKRFAAQAIIFSLVS